MNMSSKQTNILSDNASIQLFFKEKVSDAQEKQNIKISENVEFYLVNLLSEFAYSFGNAPHGEDCLALLLKRALECSKEEKICIYKKMADHALYISGFFQEYFNNKSFDIQYYVSMGERAYQELSFLLNRQNEHKSCLAQIYKEMGENFVTSMDILLHVSHECFESHKAQRSVLSIYDAWLGSASVQLEKELLGRGIIPVIGSLRKVQ
jgi:hypothetical protein